MQKIKLKEFSKDMIPMLINKKKSKGKSKNFKIIKFLIKITTNIQIVNSKRKKKNFIIFKLIKNSIRKDKSKDL